MRIDDASRTKEKSTNGKRKRKTLLLPCHPSLDKRHRSLRRHRSRTEHCWKCSRRSRRRHHPVSTGSKKRKDRPLYKNLRAGRQMSLYHPRGQTLLTGHTGLTPSSLVGFLGRRRIEVAQRSIPTADATRTAVDAQFETVADVRSTCLPLASLSRRGCALTV